MSRTISTRGARRTDTRSAPEHAYAEGTVAAWCCVMPSSPLSRSARTLATTPGGIGNVGPGLDVLGCAVKGPRDEVIAEWSDCAGVIVLESGHPELSCSATRHASAIAATAVLDRVRAAGGAVGHPGIALRVRKGLPLLGGQGGSAASAVAGASAVNALLGSPLDAMALLECSLAAEARVAGRHLDNIAPALLGGIVLVRSLDPIDVVMLPVPTALRIVIVHPAQRLSTATARGALPHHVELSIVTHQLAQVAAVVAACYTNDIELLGRAIDDRIAEPARRGLMPGFVEAKDAALAAGALGVSISGAGPSSFAVVDDQHKGERVAAAMQAAYAAQGIACSTSVTEIDREGTIVQQLEP